MDNVIELSLGKNYVSNWGLWEAVREILQNAQDSEKEGNTLEIIYHKNDECLIIRNEGTELDISSLVLGNSIKGSDNAIGKYGEGYKLALLVLLRLGHPVEIYTRNETWIPKFINSATFNTEVLAIERISDDEATDTKSITFAIENISENEFIKLKGLGLRIAKETHSYMGKTIECEYGEILLDEKYAGKFYVEGLFIQNDDNFKYGYNFKNEVVDLDRDRKAINYYDLCELTTKSLLTQEEDFEIVETSISKKTHDSKDLQYFYNQASDSFKEGYAENYIEKHKKERNTFFGTEKEVALIDDDRPTEVVDEISAIWLNDGLGNGLEYREIKEKAETKNDKEVAYHLYEKSLLKKMYDWIIHNHKRLSRTQLLAFMEMTKEINVSGISYIREEVYNDTLKKCGIENK